MNILAELRRRFADALAPVVEPTREQLDMVRRTQDAKFGDYQANMAMPLKAKLGGSPRDIAAGIAARLKIDDLCEPPEVAGPGFINLRLKDSFLAAQLQAAVADARLGVPAAGKQAKTYVLDYSGPNVAKPMHVGHIRSTVIGDALARTLRFLGHTVIGDNHLGDWGTQFGMIIYGYKHFRDEAALTINKVDELARLYRLVNQLVEYHEAKADVGKKEELVHQHFDAWTRCKTDATQAKETGDAKRRKEVEREVRRLEERHKEAEEEVASLKRKIAAVESSPELYGLAKKHEDIGTKVLAETAKLHADDPESLTLWKRFMPACLERLNEAYERLGIQFDVTLGESFYHNRLAGVVKDLMRRGIARESEGAICVFREAADGPIGNPSYEPPPMIVRKKDGAFLYSTSDLATIQYRMEQWSPDAMLYVVDHRQSLHFEQLFDVARRWGFDKVEYRHLGLGTIMGQDGKPYRTRAGDTVGLEGLLDEAVARAHRVVCELDDDPAKNPDGPQLSEDERRRVAEVVGLGGVKYADLSHNRTSDYVFDYDKMLALSGNTATYMQYAYARVQSIFRRGNVDIEKLRHACGTGSASAKAADAGLPGEPKSTGKARSTHAIILGHPAERALAIEILRFTEALEDVATDYRPNLLTGYLFDQLARQFSTFFEHCPVLKAETPALRTSRLLLCDLTARTIQKGLELLGIGIVEKM